MLSFLKQTRVCTICGAVCVHNRETDEYSYRDIWDRNEALADTPRACDEWAGLIHGSTFVCGARCRSQAMFVALPEVQQKALIRAALAIELLVPNLRELGIRSDLTLPEQSFISRFLPVSRFEDALSAASRVQELLNPDPTLPTAWFAATMQAAEIKGFCQPSIEVLK